MPSPAAGRTCWRSTIESTTARFVCTECVPVAVGHPAGRLAVGGRVVGRSVVSPERSDDGNGISRRSGLQPGARRAPFRTPRSAWRSIAMAFTGAFERYAGRIGLPFDNGEIARRYRTLGRFSRRTLTSPGGAPPHPSSLRLFAGPRADVRTLTSRPHPTPRTGYFARHPQQVSDGADTPAPALGASTMPPLSPLTAPRCTTYQTPRHEIIEAIPNERTLPPSR
jgi:hypothetical protein